MNKSFYKVFNGENTCKGTGKVEFVSIVIEKRIT